MRMPLLALLIPCAILAGCERAETPPVDPAIGATGSTATAPAEPAPVRTQPAPPAGNMPAGDAHVTLEARSGSRVTGTLALTAVNGGVNISGEIAGLTAGTLHGFHVHEFGNCTAPDAATAGEHFNPANAPHGGPDTPQHHLGDLSNVESTEDGRALVNVGIAEATLGDGGPHDLVGKSLVVHAQPDDYATQPSGGSGGRIACGVIR